MRMMPTITLRSSTRRAPGWFFGKCARWQAKRYPDSQNNERDILKPPSLCWDYMKQCTHLLVTAFFRAGANNKENNKTSILYICNLDLCANVSLFEPQPRQSCPRLLSRATFGHDEKLQLSYRQTRRQSFRSSGRSHAWWRDRSLLPTTRARSIRVMFRRPNRRTDFAR